MLKHRVIPVVLLAGYSVVKTIRFAERRNLGNPITVARIYNTRNVDELVLLDIDASKHGNQIDEFTIKEVASECFMPLAVGGGLRTIEDIARVLARGADKVVLNTISLESPDFVAEAAGYFGAQCIVVSVDVQRTPEGDYSIFSHAGLDCRSPVVEWVKRMEQLGAGELLLNSVDNDGAMNGCDTRLISLVSHEVKIPVVGVGGVGGPDDAVRVIESGASAVGAASVFHFTDHTPDDLKRAIGEAGFPVRS